jgi:hypothetical protein
MASNFFNPNIAFDPSNPQGYDYAEQQRMLLAKQQLAQALSKPLDQGKMVSGWYVGPSKGAALASGIQQALGGYMQGKAVGEQNALSKADREAMQFYRKQLGDASDPSNYADKANAAFPMPQASYTHKEPWNVGPQDPNAAQTFPVAEQPVQTPSMLPQATPVRVPPAVVQPQTGGATGSWGAEPGPLGRAQEAQRAAREASRARILATEAQMAPQAPTLPPPVLGQAMAARPPQAPLQGVIQNLPVSDGPPPVVPPTPDAGFNVTQPSPEDVQAARQGQVNFLRKSMGADRMAALDGLERTKAGGPLAQAIMMRDYTPADLKTVTQKRADGSEALLAFDPRTGATKEIGSPDPTAGQLKSSEHLDFVKQLYSGVRTQTDLHTANRQAIAAGVKPSLLSDDVTVARGRGGQRDDMVKENTSESAYQSAKSSSQKSMDDLHALLNPGAGKGGVRDATGLINTGLSKLPWATKSAETRAEVGRVMNDLVLNKLQQFTASGVGSSVFNSDLEGKRLQQAVSNIDFLRQSPEYINNNIQRIMNELADAEKRIEAARNATVPPQSRQTPLEAAPASSNVPKRGQSVSASQFGF